MQSVLWQFDDMSSAIHAIMLPWQRIQFPCDWLLMRIHLLTYLWIYLPMTYAILPSDKVADSFTQKLYYSHFSINPFYIPKWLVEHLMNISKVISTATSKWHFFNVKVAAPWNSKKGRLSINGPGKHCLDISNKIQIIFTQPHHIKLYPFRMGKQKHFRTWWISHENTFCTIYTPHIITVHRTK